MKLRDQLKQEIVELNVQLEKQFQHALSVWRAKFMPELLRNAFLGANPSDLTGHIQCLNFRGLMDRNVVADVPINKQLRAYMFASDAIMRAQESTIDWLKNEGFEAEFAGDFSDIIVRM